MNATSTSTSSQGADQLVSEPRGPCSLPRKLSMDTAATDSITVLSQEDSHNDTTPTIGLVEEEAVPLGSTATPVATTSFSAARLVRKRHYREDRFSKHYRLGRVLGKGGFGVCLACTHIATGHERACKLLPKSPNKRENRVIVGEFRAMAAMDHPNIVKVYELFEDKKHFFIVTDLYEGGDLFDLVQQKGPLTEAQAATVIQRLLCAVHYCHKNKLVHRDLKPENVLLEGSDFHNIKLIDFGLARPDKGKAFREVVGSPFYVSPQVVQGRYHKGCDVWAIGVIAYVSLCGRPPFHAPTDAEVLERIQMGWICFDDPEWDYISPQCTAFIRYLMTFEEDERPTALEALNHPWLQQQAMVATTGLPDLLLEQDIKDALQALQRFQSRDCTLKRATAALVACHFLPATKRERMDAVFRALDHGCTGTLTGGDLERAFAQYLNRPLSQEEWKERLFPHINYGGSGAVTYSEFAAIVALEARNGDGEIPLQQAYDYLDVGQKGYLTARDLQVGFCLDADTAEAVSAKMIAEVTTADQEVIARDVFERTMARAALMPVEAKPEVVEHAPSSVDPSVRSERERSPTIVAGAA